MVSMESIQEVARQIGQKFKVEKVILFGSYSKGTANEDSDVDLLVIMRHKGQPEYKSVAIRMNIKIPFSADILVRSPAYVRRRIEMGDFFMKEITEQGKVLYEASDRGVGGKGRKRLPQHAARDAVA